jgi:flagellar operon protein
MSQSFRVGQAYYPSKPGGIGSQPNPAAAVSRPFQHWLEETLQQNSAVAVEGPKLSFSHHALNRLQERGIQLADAEVARLEGAVQRAAAKGARDSLVLMDNVAYVVNIRSRKVVTALDQAHMKENVFTNIDSAVFA